MQRPRDPSDRCGQALVEFVMVLPIFMLIVVGIIEFGRLMSAHQTITDTAREATRRAVVADGKACDDKGDALRAMIRQRLSGAGLDPDSWENQDDPDDFVTCANQSGDPTYVHLEYSYRMNWLGPLIRWTTGDQEVRLRTETRMRQE